MSVHVNVNTDSLSDISIHTDTLVVLRAYITDRESVFILILYTHTLILFVKRSQDLPYPHVIRWPDVALMSFSKQRYYLH